MGSGEGVLDAADGIGGDAALLVGGAGERDDGGLARDGMDDLDGVADSVDVRVGGAHAGIGPDRPTHAELETRRSRERALGGHADGQDGDVGDDALAGVEQGRDAGLYVREAGHARAEAQVHAA